MALKQELEKAAYDKLGDDQKHYVEKGGRWYLDTDEASELSNALTKTREENQALKTRVASFEGIDPDEHKRLKAEREAATRQRDLDSGNWNKVLGEERTKAEREIAVRESRIEKLTGTLREALVDNAATRAITDADGNVTLLLPLVTKRVQLREVGDRQVAVVLNDKNEPRLREGAKGAEDFMPISEFVAELRNDKTYAGAFKGTGASGSQVRNLPAVPVDPRRASQRQQLESIQADIAAGKQKLSR